MDVTEDVAQKIYYIASKNSLKIKNMYVHTEAFFRVEFKRREKFLLTKGKIRWR